VLAATAATLGGAPARTQDIPPDAGLRPSYGVGSDRDSRDIDLARRAYIDALRRLAGGDRAAATGAASALETAVRDRDGGPDTRLLGNQSRYLVERLAGAEPDAVAGLMLLHHDLAFAHAAAGEFRLAEHARTVAEFAARAWVGPGSPPDRRRVACDMFASFGAFALQRGQPTEARRQFERALREDARCLPALLGLGTTYELLGMYPMAVAQFGAARLAAPDDPEAALRLGVNLARVGRADDALAALRAAARAGAPEWIAVVAEQEIGSVLVAAGRLEAAQRHLEDAVARRPAQAGLVIGLAHVLDLRNRPREARRVLYRLEEIPRGGDASPRMEYSAWPSSGVLAGRREFEDQAARRLAALAAALVELGWSQG